MVGLVGQLLEYLAFAKIASFECIKVVSTGSVDGWDGKLSLSEWLGYGISGRMLGGLWDGQPRALESCGNGRDLGWSWKDEGPVCA